MKDKLIPLPIIMGTALIIASIVIAYGFKNIKPSGHNFMVTGSATMRVTSDTAKLNGSISRTVPISGLEGAYTEIAQNIQQVKDLAKAQGIKDEEITVLAPSANEQFSYGQNGEITSKNYLVNQRVVISTPNIDTVTKFGNAVSQLAKQGIFFQTGGPEYYYSKLPEARVSLLGKAVKDAKARAESVAQNAGAGVGSLESVSGGIVQVLAPNSTDISDYGSYDTSTIEKDIMVTVKAEFGIK